MLERQPVPAMREPAAPDAQRKQRRNRIRGVSVPSAVKDLPIFSLGKFSTVNEVRNALSTLEATGHFGPASALVEQMGRDDRLMAVLATRALAVLGLPLKATPSGEAEGDKAVSEELRKQFFRLFPRAQLYQLMVWGLMLGVGVGQLTWEAKPATRSRPARIDCKLKVWHPRFLVWRHDTQSYWVSTADAGMVEVTPGDGQWVVFTPFGLDRGWMYGHVRQLAIPWLLRTWATRDWGRHSEVHGIPARIAEVPLEASEEEGDDFVNAVANLASEPVIKVEKGSANESPKYDYRLVEAARDSSTTFRGLIDLCNEAMAVSLLGQNLTTTVEGGSRAAAEVHERIRWDLLAWTAISLSDCLNEQALPWWGLFNLGDREAVPQIELDSRPPEDLKASADTFVSLGAALSGLLAIAPQVDVGKLLEKFGIPVRELSADELKGPQAQVFEYDLTNGVVTPNEARERKGFPPRAGGDETIPERMAREAKAAADSAPKPTERLSALEQGLATVTQALTALTDMVATLTGKPSPKASGKTSPDVTAQAYLDSLEAHAREQAQPFISADLEKLLAVINDPKVTSYAEMRTALLAAYKSMDASGMEDVMQRALVLAELNGRVAIVEST